MTGSILEEIIRCSSEVYKDFESHIAVGIWKIGNPIWKTAKSNDIVR